MIREQDIFQGTVAGAGYVACCDDDFVPLPTVATSLYLVRVMLKTLMSRLVVPDAHVDGVQGQGTIETRLHEVPF